MCIPLIKEPPKPHFETLARLAAELGVASMSADTAGQLGDIWGKGLEPVDNQGIHIFLEQ